MRQRETKPEAILQLEQELGFELTLAPVRAWGSKTYTCDHEGEAIELNLSKCDLEEVPNLLAFEKLQILNLSHNKIGHIEGLDKLANLQSLYLSGNQLVRIEGLDKLCQLERLDLSDNKLSVIENLPQTNLKELKVGGNNIEYIRSSFSDKDSELRHCRLIFDSYGNHLEDIQRWQKRNPLPEKLQLPIKVMLLGNHSSGKSTFLDSLCGGERRLGAPMCFVS